MAGTNASGRSPVRAVSRDGVRAIDLSREPARYRSLSVDAGNKALSHGLSRTRPALDAGRCQREQSGRRGRNRTAVRGFAGRRMLNRINLLVYFDTFFGTRPADALAGHAQLYSLG